MMFERIKTVVEHVKTVASNYGVKVCQKIKQIRLAKNAKERLTAISDFCCPIFETVAFILAFVFIFCFWFLANNYYLRNICDYTWTAALFFALLYFIFGIFSSSRRNGLSHFVRSLLVLLIAIDFLYQLVPVKVQDDHFTQFDPSLTYVLYDPQSPQFQKVKPQVQQAVRVYNHLTCRNFVVFVNTRSSNALNQAFFKTMNRSNCVIHKIPNRSCFKMASLTHGKRPITAADIYQQLCFVTR